MTLVADLRHQYHCPYAVRGILEGQIPDKISIWPKRCNPSRIYVWSDHLRYSGRSLWTAEGVRPGVAGDNLCLFGLCDGELRGQQFHVTDWIFNFLEISQ